MRFCLNRRSRLAASTLITMTVAAFVEPQPVVAQNGFGLPGSPSAGSPSAGSPSAGSPSAGTPAAQTASANPQPGGAGPPQAVANSQTPSAVQTPPSLRDQPSPQRQRSQLPAAGSDSSLPQEAA